MYKKIIQTEVIIYRETSRAEGSYSGDYEQTEVFMKQAVERTEKEKLTNLPHSLFSYAKILFKQGKMNEAIQVSK
ncbi:hypothetical protein ABE206_12765 [Bacillus spizizenii]|nr:hypothetical protein [Bacillus spizizenii]